MSNANTPVKLTTALREAKWWPEFISIKDDFSWETLAKRFNTHAHLLRRAAKEAGVEKKALPPGGLRVIKAEEAPPVKAEPVTMTDLSPDGRIGAVSDRIGALSDADVAKLANVSAADVRAFRLRNKLPTHKADVVAEAPVAAPAPEPKRRGRPPKARPEAVVAAPAPVAAPAKPAPVAAPAKPAPAPAPVAVETGRRRGINPYGRKGHPLKKHTELFGKMSDADIAKAADVTADVVAEYREKHRLPAYVAEVKKASAKPAAKPAPVAAPAPVVKPAPVVEPTPMVVAPPVPKAVEVAPAPKKRGRPPKVRPVVEAAPVAAPAPVVAPEPAAVAAPVAAPTPAPVAPVAPAPVAAPVAAPVVAELTFAWVVNANNGSTTASFSLTGANAEQAVTNAVSALGRRTDGPWTVIGITRGFEALS